MESNSDTAAQPILSIRKVTRNSPETEHIKMIYRHAFPQRERMPFHSLLHDRSEFISFYEGDLFCGFASLLTHQDITHILYFAIDGKLQKHGYGSAALHAMRVHFSGRLIVDIEMDHEGVPNGDQRRHRKHFYLQNGYKESGIRYLWQNEQYEILVNGGELDSAEFKKFWHHFALEGADPIEC